MTNSSSRRLSSIVGTFKSPPNTVNPLGTLNLGGISYPVLPNRDPVRLPSSERTLLSWSDPEIASHLQWLAKKFLLKQDVFLISSPGPFARNLALTWCSLTNQSFEIITLHRDVGEVELKQGRELRSGILDYVDGPAVRAVKNGSVLILDGVERAERGVLPILNSLLETREMNLENGMHIIAADRYDLMVQQRENVDSFIRAHPDFRVIAIGVPVPPYKGFPLDPPFRSRFQVRYLDPLTCGKSLSLSNSAQPETLVRLSEAITQLQVTKEMKTKIVAGISSRDELPPFPQTALRKLNHFLSVFPLSPSTPLLVLSRILLTIHPSLAHTSQANWRTLEEVLLQSNINCVGIAEIDHTLTTQDSGLGGWKIEKISRKDDTTASVTFVREGERITINAPAGPKAFEEFPPKHSDDLHITSRFTYLLTSLIQLHSLGHWDISFIPATNSIQSSSSSSTTLISTFAGLFGYELETVHLVKDLTGGRELWMRRVVEKDEDEKETVTRWEPSTLTKGALEGHLVHFEGIDTLGPTVASLARFVNDRETELWEGQRLVSQMNEDQRNTKLVSLVHPSFRLIVTPSKSTVAHEWLNEEFSSMFISLPMISMSLDEEAALLLSTGCSIEHVEALENFTTAYRKHNSVPGSKNRRLGTATLLRIAKRLAQYPDESLSDLLNRALLSDFLPTTSQAEFYTLLLDNGIRPLTSLWNPPPEVRNGELVFPAATGSGKVTQECRLPLYDSSKDPDGVPYIPYMEHYLNNPQQTKLMRDIATDLLILGEHVLLLGAQGTGKNKITDRVLQLLSRPREFIQLHRDSTPQSIIFQTTLEKGIVKYTDSPLIRAIRYGRVIVIDETDKSSAHVVAMLSSLASRGEMNLPDGRKVVPASKKDKKENDIVLHSEFRMILLGNRPGFPFLGNEFLRMLGDNFSCYAVTNPDLESELKILTGLAPDLNADTLKALVQTFQELREAFHSGTIAYPFSLRELLAIVRHMKRFPTDSLEQVLRNVFDFDISRPETLQVLYDILHKYHLDVSRVGIDAVRGVGESSGTAPVVIDFEPTGDTSLTDPKFGKEDNESHVGGNTFAGGTGGRSTAGLGGRGGYMRLYKGQNIHQIPDSLKANVPEEVKSRAREMARKELKQKLEELEMSSGEANAYTKYFNSAQAQIHQLVTFLDNLEANEDERIWIKRQTDGDLDEARLSEGVAGESTIYKRRATEKPELGRPQLKPKRIRFVFDLSASMYRNQFDGRLERSLEAAVMIMEAFARLQNQEKYSVEVVGHSGEKAVIPLISADSLPQNPSERWKIVQKMALIPQYCWSGDHTIEAIEEGVEAVSKEDADDHFLIVISDANFERYGIGATDIKKALSKDAKVKAALIAIGEGAESEWLPRLLPGRAFRVKQTSDIGTTLRIILTDFASQSRQ